MRPTEHLGRRFWGSLGCRLSRKNTHQIKSLELWETGTVAPLNSRRLLSAYLAPFRYPHYKRPTEGLCFAILRRPRRLREMSLIMLLGPILQPCSRNVFSLSTQIASCLPACEHHLAPCGVTYFLFFSWFIHIPTPAPLSLAYLYAHYIPICVIGLSANA